MFARRGFSYSDRTRRTIPFGVRSAWGRSVGRRCKEKRPGFAETLVVRYNDSAGLRVGSAAFGGVGARRMK